MKVANFKLGPHLLDPASRLLAGSSVSSSSSCSSLGRWIGGWNESRWPAVPGSCRQNPSTDERKRNEKKMGENKILTNQMQITSFSSMSVLNDLVTDWKMWAKLWTEVKLGENNDNNNQS